MGTSSPLMMLAVVLAGTAVVIPVAVGVVVTSSFLWSTLFFTFELAVPISKYVLCSLLLSSECAF